MNCRRAEAIDVEEFLLRSEAPEFDDFRAHSVECADCTAALERLGDFEAALLDELSTEAGEGDFHPPSEWLASFISGRFDQEANRLQTESHLERCAACRSELALMQTFDAEAVQEATGGRMAAAAALKTTKASAPGLWEQLRRALSLPSGLGGAVPALAAGLLVLLAFALFMSRDSESEPPKIAQEAPPAQSPSVAPLNPVAPMPHASPEFSPELIAREEVNPSTPRQHELAPPPLPESSAPQEQLAEITPPSPAPLPSSAPSPAPSSPRATEDSLTAPDSGLLEGELLLASLGDLGALAYQMPNGATPSDGFEIFGTTRGSEELPKIRIMAPARHIGFTRDASPQLWWSLASSTALPVMIVVDREDADEPLLETTLRGPQPGGFRSVDLGSLGVSLEPGVDYQWFVSLIVDPKRPSKNPVAGGLIRVLSEEDPRAQRAAAATPLEQGHTAAAEGLWYDAFNRFAEIAAQHPEVEAAARYRDEMIRQSR